MSSAKNVRLTWFQGPKISCYLTLFEEGYFYYAKRGGEDENAKPLWINSKMMSNHLYRLHEQALKVLGHFFLILRAPVLNLSQYLRILCAKSKKRSWALNPHFLDFHKIEKISHLICKISNVILYEINFLPQKGLKRGFISFWRKIKES